MQCSIAARATLTLSWYQSPRDWRAAVGVWDEVDGFRRNNSLIPGDEASKPDNPVIHHQEHSSQSSLVPATWPQVSQIHADCPPDSRKARTCSSALLFHPREPPAVRGVIGPRRSVLVMDLIRFLENGSANGCRLTVWIMLVDTLRVISLQTGTSLQREPVVPFLRLGRVRASEPKLFQPFARTSAASFFA